MRPLTVRRIGCAAARRAAAGFTLIEMLIVVALVGILASIAMPQFRTSVLRTKESVLREDLWVLRNVIDQYFTDKGQYPSSPEDLVTYGYIRRIPPDPLTESIDTWVWATEPLAEDEDQPPEEQGITDVRSGAPGTSLDGTDYSEW